MRSDWLTQGPVIKAFEDALATRVGARYAISCSSGTAALHLAAMAASIGPDDTVIVSANTFLATANAMKMCGAEVVFADIDSETGLMNAAHVEAAIRRAKGKRSGHAHNKPPRDFRAPRKFERSDD